MATVTHCTTSVHKVNNYGDKNEQPDAGDEGSTGNGECSGCLVTCAKTHLSDCRMRFFLTCADLPHARAVCRLSRPAFLPMHIYSDFLLVF